MPLAGASLQDTSLVSSEVAYELLKCRAAENCEREVTKVVGDSRNGNENGWKPPHSCGGIEVVIESRLSAGVFRAILARAEVSA
jgi:hypothetical protein